MYEFARAKGQLNLFGRSTIATEREGEHAVQGGAIAQSITGKHTVNFTSGQGIVYGIEQYYHVPGKMSAMVLEVTARALTKHALNVHCGQENIDYKAQKALLAKVDKGEISIADLKAKGRQLLDEQEPVNA